MTGASVASSVTGGSTVLSTGTTQKLVIAGSALAKLGLTAGTTNVGAPTLSGQTLTIAATGGGVATNVTFGTGAGQVSTLNQLNTALAANKQAGIDTTGKISITTTNDAAFLTIGAIAGPSAFQRIGR